MESHQPQRVCRKCQAINATPGEFCPRCGTSYLRRGAFRRTRDRIGGWSGRKKLAVFALPLLVLMIGGGVGTYLKIDHDNRVQAEREADERERREAKAERDREAREAAEQERRFQAELDRLERQGRRSTVASLEKAVTEDAQEAVNDGLLDGPILRTQCDPVSGETPMDLSVDAALYDCLAIYKEDEDGTSTGWTYSADVNFKSGRYSWSLGRD